MKSDKHHAAAGIRRAAIGAALLKNRHAALAVLLASFGRWPAPMEFGKGERSRVTWRDAFRDLLALNEQEQIPVLGGADEKRRNAEKSPKQLAAFCLDSVAVKGWLPPELRGPNYQPSRKAPAPDPKAKAKAKVTVTAKNTKPAKKVKRK